MGKMKFTLRTASRKELVNMVLEYCEREGLEVIGVAVTRKPPRHLPIEIRIVPQTKASRRRSARG